jgi:hypothetical protein
VYELHMYVHTLRSYTHGIPSNAAIWRLGIKSSMDG